MWGLRQVAVRAQEPKRLLASACGAVDALRRQARLAAVRECGRGGPIGRHAAPRVDYAGKVCTLVERVPVCVGQVADLRVRDLLRQLVRAVLRRGLVPTVAARVALEALAVAVEAAREDCAVTDPPLVPVLGDGPVHVTACLHPLQVGEDLSLASPRVDDTEIDTSPEQEAASA